MRRTFIAAVILIGIAPGITFAQGKTDWGGGYFTGPDSAASIAATAGSGPQSSNAGSAETLARCRALAGFAVAYAKESDNRTRFAQIIDAPTSVLTAEVHAAEGDLPEVCRVNGVVAPDIAFEMRLPTTAWNGKFMHFGCGGMCGVVYRTQAEEPLVRGYAVIASNMGHNGAPNNQAYRMGDITALIDFSFRASHVVTLAGKEIADAYYGKPAARSYFMGCSTGGVQAMIEMQRYPYDHDGLIAGAPAYGTGPSYLEWGARANIGADGKAIMGSEKLPLVRKAVLAACDATDGLKDGLIMNPVACKWDPSELECKAGAGPDCLTKAEADVIRRIYDGPTNSKGESLSYGYAGMTRGSEYSWSPAFIAPMGEKATRLIDLASSFGDGYMPVVAARAGRAYDYDLDPKLGNWGFGGPVLQWLRYAMNPDVRRFRDGGAKMIAYHGWDDNEVAPGSSVDYYETVSKTMGGDKATQEFFRLFMIPGMGHCRRGPGGDAVDWITALENWVEQGKAPDKVIVHHLATEQNYMGLPRVRFPLASGSFDRTRPAFPHPAVAKYAGRGDANNSDSWIKSPR